MASEVVPLFTVRELQSWPYGALQRLGKHLYKKGCKDQQNSIPQERNEEGHCSTSIQCVEQIREVIVVLHEKGKNFRNDSVEYVFPRHAGTEPAAVISAIFNRCFISQCSGFITLTRIAREQDGGAVVVTTILPNLAKRTAQILTLEAVTNRLEEDS